MAKKEEQVEVVEPEVVEDRVTKDIAIRQASAQRTDIKKAITRQVATVQGVELRGNFEKLKLGAMVSEAVRILKLDGEAERGPSAKGGGALGWWNDVCPADESGAPVIPYQTVMRWKQAAENLPLMMGEDGFEVGKMIALMAKNPKKVVGKDAKILKSAEKAVNGMTMRQMLLWGGDEAAPKNKGGRPKAEKTEFVMKPKEENSADIWAGIKADFEGPAAQKAVKYLNAEATTAVLDSLRRLVAKFEEHLAKISK